MVHCCARARKQPSSNKLVYEPSPLRLSGKVWPTGRQANNQPSRQNVYYMRKRLEPIWLRMC
eukprot:2620232-Prorocentrum_lima.AAC.1